MSAPIPALTPLRPIEAWLRQAGGREAQVGELLRLRVALTAEGGLLGETEEGLQVGLPPGLGRPGDLLLMRVLAREPRLQLQLMQREAVADAEADELPGGDWGWRALRPDQGRLQRWHLDQDARLPAQVGAQWRSQLLSEQLRAAQGPAGQAPGSESPWAAHAAPVQLVGWLSPLSGFWPLPPRQDDAGRAGGNALMEAGVQDDGVCLCLNLDTPEGWVLVLLQWHHGLLLHCCAERAEALPWMRARLPAVARALAAVPLRLRHCSLGLHPPPLPEAGPAQRAQGLASAASLPLFRAAAEIARLLQA
jgi:hypothetical protein